MEYRRLGDSGLDVSAVCLGTMMFGGATDEPTPSYDFYNMLPKFEVVVPEKDKDVKPDVRTAHPDVRPRAAAQEFGKEVVFAENVLKPG